MMDYSATLMVTVLRKEYPEIANVIAERINKTLPEEQLTDIKQITSIVETFKKEKSITEENWTSGKTKVKITNPREELIAVILLFYHPEKLLQLTTGNTKYGVLKYLSDEIGTLPEILSMAVSNVIVAFRAYEPFKKEVYRLYELIKIENKFFE